MSNLFYLLGRTLCDVIDREKLAYVPFPMKREGDHDHLRQTIRWLVRAAENGEGGVSSHYSLLHGRWLPPFPETTGYIIPTLFDYAQQSGEALYADLARRLTDWLAEVQLENGACMQGTYDRRTGNNKPLIFNTGQNIFGFLRSYKEAGDEAYLDSACRAGDFLTRQVDRRGCWNQALHHDLPHTYNARSAWALLALHAVTGDGRYEEIARANLDWVVAQQTENGWFQNANFKPGELPNTHGLAYTIRGLLESYALTEEASYLAAARRTADRFQRLFEIRKQLYIFWDANWRNQGKYVSALRGRHVCVTGNVQLALVWMRLFEVVEESTYVNSAFKMIDYVKTLQNLDTSNEGVRGGIPGAFPIYGSYSSLKFPNWAAKFFADALMMKLRLMDDPRITKRALPTVEVAR